MNQELNGGVGDDDGDGVPLVVVEQGRLVAHPLRRNLVPGEDVELENPADQGQRHVVELKFKTG